MPLALVDTQVIVPLQIGVVFNASRKGSYLEAVIVPLQIGVVFNEEVKKAVGEVSYRPLTNRGSL